MSDSRIRSLCASAAATCSIIALYCQGVAWSGVEREGGFVACVVPSESVAVVEHLELLRVVLQEAGRLMMDMGLGGAMEVKWRSSRWMERVAKQGFASANVRVGCEADGVEDKGGELQGREWRARMLKLAKLLQWRRGRSGRMDSSGGCSREHRGRREGRRARTGAMEAGGR